MRICLILILLSTGVAHAQLYDKSWALGYPCVKVTFDADSGKFSHIIKGIPAVRCSGSISDAQGELTLVSLGMIAYNRDGDTLENGNYLVDSLFSGAGYYPANQGVIILPKRSAEYYIVSFSRSDSISGFPYPDNLYYSVADMGANGGLGKVVSKRNLLYHAPQGDGRLTACLHANGRDWWVVNHGYCNNEYLIYLFTPDTVIGPRHQFIGPPFCKPDYLSQAVFSPDGNMYASGTVQDTVVGLMDFDRCSGDFSNARIIPLKRDTVHFPNDTLKYIFTSRTAGVAFSPNNRFLYIASFNRVKQYDLHAPDITASQVPLFYDTPTINPFKQISNICLVPSGQIYLLNINGFPTKLTYIKYPDSLGVACQFKLYSLDFDSTISPTSAGNVPTTMRLGALKGSGCDTIPTGINDVAQSKIVVSPNPAHTTLSVSLRQYERDAMLYIYDGLGREMYSNRHFYLDDYINVRNYPVGVYYLRLQSASGEYSSKFIKE